jgi:hypothetical protein
VESPQSPTPFLLVQIAYAVAGPIVNVPLYICDMPPKTLRRQPHPAIPAIPAMATHRNPKKTAILWNNKGVAPGYGGPAFGPTGPNRQQVPGTVRSGGPVPPISRAAQRPVPGEHGLPARHRAPRIASRQQHRSVFLDRRRARSSDVSGDGARFFAPCFCVAGFLAKGQTHL